MSRTAFVTPKPGLTIRDPQTLAVLPAEGAEVPHNAYWQRRIQAGDVTVRKAKPSKATAKPAGKPAAKTGSKE